jgi:subtilisin family serine protease
MGASANDGYGITGVAWNMTILPVRFLDDNGGGSLDDAVSAIQYATKMKVNIMSNSWGGGAFSQALMDAITAAKDAGILFVVAAGNSSSDNDAQPAYPANYAVDNIISVAAIDPNGNLADFSNYGATTVHIAAPGVAIESHTMKGLESWDGTSMATPHVTGVAALLWSQDASQTYLQIKSRILASARPLAGLRGRVATGGMVNAYYALTNQVAPADPLDPYGWQKMAQTGGTPHPYDNSTNKSFTFTVPGAKHVAVSFTGFATESGYDKVSFKDAAGNVVKGTLSGKLGKVFGPVVDGDTVTVVFTSDSSNTDYGFDIDGVSYQ